VDIPGVTWIVQYDTPGEERNYGRRLGHRFVWDQAAEGVSCPVYTFNFDGFKFFKKYNFQRNFTLYVQTGKSEVF